MFSFDVFLLPILILLPGYCLLPHHYPSKLRLLFAVFVSFCITSVLGLVMMSVGAFSTALIAAFEVPLLLLRWRSRRWPSLCLREHLVVLGLFSALAAFAFLSAGEPFDADGDAGVYAISAQHLQQSGSWTWPLDDLIPEATEIRDLVISSRAYVNPWDEVAPGFLTRGDTVVPQFLPLYPLWGAIFGTAMPAGHEIYGILTASVLGVLMLLLAAGQLFSLFLPRPGVIIALVLLAGNPILLVFLKYPSAECFLAGLLAGQLFFTTLFLRRSSLRSGLLPASLLALAILTKFFAWAVSGGVFLVLFLLPMKRWHKTLPFLLLTVPAIALSLHFAGPHLSNHLGQLVLLEGFKLIIGACLILIVIRALWPRIENWAQFGLAAVFTGTIVFLWAAGEVSRSGIGRFVHDFAALSGFPFLIAAVVGLGISCHRRRSIAHLLPAFVFVLLTSFLLLGSGDTIFYPFAARRFLVITVPLGCLYCATLLYRSRMLAIVGTLAVLLPPIVTQRDAIFVQQGKGFLATLEELDKGIADQTVFATESMWRYTPHLLLNNGRSVFCFDTRNGWRGFEPLLKTQNIVQLLSDTKIGPSNRLVASEKRKIIRASTTPPLKTGFVRHEFSLGELRASDLEALSILTLGENDAFLVSLFHKPEVAGDRSFRWTGPQARIRMKSGAAVRFTWSPGGNPERPLPARIFANGQHLGFASVGAGWHTSRWFSLPPGADKQNEMIVEIRTHAFRPADHGSNSDQRLLGLRLHQIEVR